MIPAFIVIFDLTSDFELLDCQSSNRKLQLQIENQNELLGFFDVKDLTAFVGPGLGVDAVRTLRLTGVLI